MVGRLTDWLKPQPQEALIRLRNSGLAFLSFVLLIYLLDIKSLYLLRCWRVAFGRDMRPYGVGRIGWMISVIELTFITLLFLNIIQSLYALKYPPAPLPPTPASSRKLLLTPRSTPTKSSKLLGTSPSTSPLSFSQSLSQSQSHKQFPFRPSTSSIYLPSPLSTPARSSNYSLSFPSSSKSLFDSASSSFSSSGMGWSPSKSPLLKYSGRKGGRALESSFLKRLTSEDTKRDK
ncbi:hypothetical protein NEOLEDRAFT_1241773 [Neolentinus lepideus HHB14362 ss-1]|uniref:Uncharacterized protein n=1 Tax=Neolentinus lepideus HHB14362 ss-1 TaxID=1314782 RepID=A0A165SK66_9AGAM|nr:hypothetical protein NEOLEDRAFT_1241773 [Neolentinus lepideus HHB14362 ss-1]